jgi:Domain of unknown function (DUF6265)
MNPHRSLLIVLTVMLMPLCVGQSTPAASKPAPAKARLEDLAFLSGHNRGEMEGGIIDEHWSEVGGDSMIGMFRYIKSGKVQMYEFMTIEQTPDGPVLRLKHFNPGLVGWEEKVQVYSYPLISWKPDREAVFERPDKASRITYRSTSKDTLQSTVEHTGKKPEVYEFAHTPE